MKFRERQRRTGVALDITPLIDVMFNLLVFLVVTTSFVDGTRTSLDLELPSAADSPKKKVRRLVIGVDAAGGLAVDGAHVGDPAALMRELRRSFATDAERVVHIEADSRVPHGLVVQVMDTARRAGFAELAIVARPAD